MWNFTGISRGYTAKRGLLQPLVHADRRAPSSQIAGNLGIKGLGWGAERREEDETNTKRCSPALGTVGSGWIPANSGSSGGRLWSPWAAALRWSTGDGKRLRRCGSARRSPWWCRLHPVELKRGDTASGQRWCSVSATWTAETWRRVGWCDAGRRRGQGVRGLVLRPFIGRGSWPWCRARMLRGSNLSMAALGCRAQMVKERNGEPERGEWKGADKNSTQEYCLWTQFHSDTSASFSCQAHVATRVLLDLGARSNQQLLETRSGKQLETAAGNQN
jgi:hypothetical protein